MLRVCEKKSRTEEFEPDFDAIFIPYVQVQLRCTLGAIINVEFLPFAFDELFETFGIEEIDEQLEEADEVVRVCE